MNDSTSETTETATSAAAPKPEASETKAKIRATGPRVASAKGKPTGKATLAKKKQTIRTTKGATKVKTARPAKPAKGAVREGSKSAKLLALLQRNGGATMKELMKTSGWRSHSLRGWISAVVGKKMGLKVQSTRETDGERTYSIAS